MCNQTICRCGFDSCLNGGFFYEPSCLCICPTQFVGIRCDNLTTTQPTTTVKISCPVKLDCLNGALQNPKTCKCECNIFYIWFLQYKYKNILKGYSAYTGLLCETLVCTNEPAQCKDRSIFTVGDCSLSAAVPFYCPGNNFSSSYIWKFIQVL